MVLTGKTEKEVLERIAVFRQEFKNCPWLAKASKRANNIGEYAKKEERLGKAQYVWTRKSLFKLEQFKENESDKHSMEIVDGMKVMVCKLKKNPIRLHTLHIR